ncbi:MAG: ParA family protein [Desulfobacteraceae bacterium]|jgi:chromosome partitioning protein
MGKIICISSQKGGVGKTTTAVNLSTALALAEQNTLLLDLDFQGHTTGVLTPSCRHERSSIYDVIIGEKSVEDIIRDAGMDFLKLVPADNRLINADYGPGPDIGKEPPLKVQLNRIKKDFDYIIIDSPPSFTRLGINGINAADIILIPLQCEYFALESLAQFFKIFHSLKKKHEFETEIGGILLNMYDPDEDVSAQIAGDVKKDFDGMVYKTIIPRCRSIRESASHGKSIILTDITSEGAKSFISLAGEIIVTMHS